MNLARDTVAAPAQVAGMRAPSIVAERASPGTRWMGAAVRPDIFFGQRVQPDAAKSANVQMKEGSTPGHEVHKLAAEGISGSSLV